MSPSRDRTLARIHRSPTPADIRWQDLISTLKFHGVEVTERKGSRVGLRLGDERMVVHRPHPGSVTGRATVRDIAGFLKAAGIVVIQEQDDDG
ncbi:MAG: type II toxin-antitoxin system HicA family toxin [Gammaproteobacteria bacterium]|nr:type II toxin-antitoxin system HicA family toxin [Gammaproteobacteria bacterium]